MVILSALVDRFSVSRMRDFFYKSLKNCVFFLNQSVYDTPSSFYHGIGLKGKPWPWRQPLYLNGQIQTCL